MNRIYRVVRSRKSGQWVVASEVARGHGKPKSIALAAALSGLCLGLGGTAALAADPSAVPVNGSAARAYVAGNGVTVVDIQPANAAGLSHNQYLRFDSTRQGLVLNNADGLGQTTVQTQLAGQIVTNQNLARSAQVILNEVSGNQRSVLQGFLEVAGPAADVVLANPFGISCNGCGFINTTRATLSTGTPIVGADGTLGGLRVSGGDIAIEGNGLNATGTQILDLVTRSLRVDGPLNGNDLGLFTGPMVWNFADRSPGAERVAGSGSVAYAVDSSVLGGMYANTIRLVATEAGVGVRSLGEVAATAGDFVLTANGQVSLSGRVSAQRDVQIQATAAGATAALALDDASLSAERDIRLASDGTLRARGGLLVAGHDLVLAAAALDDGATNHPQLDNNARYAAHSLQVELTGAATLDRSSWRSGGGFSLAAASILAAADGTRLVAGGDMALKARSGALDLGQAQALAGGALDLQAATRIATQAGSTQQVTAQTGGLNLRAQSLDNAGLLQANTESTINVDTLDNRGTLVLSRTPGAADVDRVQVGGNFSNATGAALLSAGDLRLQVGNQLTNDGTVQARHHSLVAAAVLDNAGRLMLSTDAPADGVDELQVGALHNLAGGVIASSGSLSQGGSTLDNQGQLLAGRNADLRYTDTLIGADGLLQAGGSLTLQGSSLTLDGVRSRMQGAGSGLGAVQLALAQRIDNAGQLLSGTSMEVSAPNLVNRSGAQLAAQGTLSADARTLLSQQGTIQGSDVHLSTPQLDNSGTVAASGALAIDDAGARAATLNQSGRLLGGSVDVRAAQATLAAGSLLQASGDLSLQGSDLTVDRATLQGALDGHGQVTLALDATLANAGNVLSGAALQVTTPTLTQSAAATLSAQGALAIDAATRLDNHGQMLAGGAARLQAGDVALGNAALLQAGGALQLDARSLQLAGSQTRVMGATGGDGALVLNLAQPFTNPALIYSGHDLQINAPAISNGITGGIAADHALTLTASAGDLSNLGALYAGGDLAASASGNLYNRITYHLTGATPTTQLQVIDSQSSINAGGSVTLAAQTVVNSSTIDAAGDVNVRADRIHNQVQDGDSRATTGRLDFNASSSSNDHYSFPDKYSSTNYTNTWHNDQYFANGRPALRPQITAGGTVALQGFSSGKNLGGVIQGDAVRISSDVGGATFLNDDLSLLRTDSTETWSREIHYIALGPLTYSDSTTPHSVVTSNSTLSSVGATIRARTLDASGFALTNAGSPYAPAAATAPDGTAAAGLPGHTTAQADSVALSATGLPAAMALPGLNITLPKNPNGYFVTNRDPSARFLVEANPKFQVGVSTVGSDFLATQLGLDPGTTEKRLGDASYEAYLVKQQLVAQTGASLVSGYDNFATLMEGMMSNAAQQAGGLGLQYGQPPSPEQLAQLTEDIIWMVSTVIDGQTVLAPVVYLAPSTLASVDTGAVIFGDKTTMALESLTNSGGTLVAQHSMAITARGDIQNLSGAIKGGDLSLQSTDGSIVNKTISQTTGDERNAATDIGRQASIAASGNLALDARRNIENIGAQMAAGGDASLNAGENIVFDTVEDKSASTTSKVVTAGLASGVETSTTSSTRHLQSGLTVGGNLNAKAGNDITLAGTNANVGGDGNIDAGGNLNVVARDNTTETNSHSSVTGLGVGGGVWGTTETTSNSFSSRNQGSNLNIGGKADLSAGQTLTVQGSNIDVGGDTSISATDVQVLAGRDIDRSSSTTTTTTFLKIEDGGGSSASSAAGQRGGERGAEAGDGAATAAAGASADGQAEASHQANAGLTLAQNTVSQNAALSQRSVGSQLNLGGNVSINARKDVTLQGSTLDAAGNVDVQAESVKLLAAQNIEQSSSSTTTTSVGLYASTDNSASAKGEAGTGAEAGAEAAQGGGSAAASAKASAQAGAEGSAEASSKNTLDVLRIQSQTQENLDVTHTGSAIRSGGNMNIQASKNLQVVGSELAAEGDVNLQARDMSFEAAQDTSYSKSTSSSTSVGLYLDAGAKASGKASASAEAGADANTVAASAGAKAEAGAEGEAHAGVAAGIQTTVNRSLQEQGSSTALISSIRSGSGSITRKAEGTIRDVGTSIEAAGDLNQSAITIESLAANNSQFSRSSEETVTARVGVYAEANAAASVSASAEGAAGTDGSAPSGQASAEASASADAKVGVETSVNREASSESSRATQAVVSSIKVGGNVNSASSGKTTLQGTSIDAGRDISLSARELDIQAARDTEEQTSSQESTSARVAVNVGVGGEASASASTEDGVSGPETSGGLSVGVEAQGSHEQSAQQSRSSNAVVSNIGGGGKLTINTQGSTRIEGANLSGQDGVDISAKDLDFKAAQNTYSSSENSTKAEAEVKASIAIVGNDNSLAASGSGESSNAQESGSDAVAGSIRSGSSLNIRTQGDTRLEGTQIESGGDSSISAGGDVKFDAARSTREASSSSVNASAGFDTGAKSVEAAGGFSQSKERSSEAVTGSLASGGSLNISAGRNASFEGSNLAAAGDAQIAAGNNVAFNAARSESSSESSSAQVGVAVGQTDESDDEAKTDTTARSGSLSVEAAQQRSRESTAVTGSLAAGNNLSVVAGNNARFEGTALAAGNAAAVAAGGNVDFVAAESRSESSGFGLTLGAEGSTEHTRPQAAGADAKDSKDAKDAKAEAKDDAKDGAKEEDEAAAESRSSTQSGSIGLAVNAANATTQSGATVNAGAGGIQVSSGGNVQMQGTQMQTDGAARIAAAGTVTRSAVQSSSSAFGMSAGASAERTEQVGGDEPGTSSQGSGGLTNLSAEASRSSQGAQIDAGGGSKLLSGIAPELTIAGVSMVLQSTVSADGTHNALLPLPGTLPPGKQVLATAADGSPLPSWVIFDAATGRLSGKPPADFDGALNLVVDVPQADGSSKKLGVEFVKP